MSYLDYNLGTIPTGWRKLLHVLWPLVFLLAAVWAAMSAALIWRNRKTTV